MEMPKPTQEHDWLQRLVGEWTYAGECGMPDGSTTTHEGTESVRSLGGLWTIGEMRGTGPDGNPATSFMTIGYDPARQKFVGTFVASMMPNLWLYEGSLDESGHVLTLASDGPSFSGEGTAHYEDIIEFTGDGTRLFRSRVQQPDGSWLEFMKVTYREIG